MRPNPTVLLTTIAAALLATACAASAPQATSTAASVDVTTDRHGQQTSGVLGVRVSDRSAELRTRRGTTALQVQIANGMPWDIQVRRDDFMLVDSEGRRYHASVDSALPNHAISTVPGTDTRHHLAEPKFHAEQHGTGHATDDHHQQDISLAGYMPRPSPQPPATTHHHRSGTTTGYTRYRGGPAVHHRHHYGPGWRTGVHVGIGPSWGYYSPYASWHGPYASWHGPCSSWRCGTTYRHTAVVVTPRTAPERRAAPPQPMARTDVGRMFRTVTELGDDSLQPGGEVAGLLSFSDLPTDRDLTLVWTPRSWHGPRQMDPVEVPVELSRRR